jgi:DNA-binding GntR family transcriptional regulator
MVDEHRELLAALQSRDPERMRAELEQHIAVPSPHPAGNRSNSRKRARRKGHEKPAAKKGSA